MGYKLGSFGLYELKTLYFPGFWPKMAPQETKNGRFWAEMGEHKSAFFSKTPSLNCLKMHHNKVLGSILIADIYILISMETFDIENIKYEKTLATVRFRYIL